MIKIIADSTCDLSKEIIEKYDIGVAPLTITIDGKIYRDKIDIMPDAFYKIIEELKETPTTAMPSPMEYYSLIEKAVYDGYNEILIICMSSGTSGSYQSAEIAKSYFFDEHLDSNIKIHVVDSKSMSHGSGWLILKTAKLRDKRATFEQLVEFNEAYKTSVKHFLSVDDLNHLIRSGRLTNASAFIGKLLMLKPIMTMRKGKGAIVAKLRGRKSVLKHYVSEFVLRNDPEVTDFIIIGYTSDYIYAKNLETKIRNETDFEGDIFIMQMGVAVGTHVGLGAISMFFVEKGKLHDGLLVNEMKHMLDRKKEIIGAIKKLT
jgi:DegV family protein with EDD domain